MNQEKLLELKHLDTAYRFGDDYYNAVEDVSLTLHHNEVLAIVGESGCGKSTLATAIMGLHNRNNTRMEGEVLYKDKNLLNYTEDEYNDIRGKEIGMIFQDPLGSLNPLMRVGDQINEALFYHSDMNKQERYDRVIHLLERVQIVDPKRVYRQYPYELSGGMRQRIVIAIALANDPNIIIADEPTTALDVIIQAEILRLMKDIEKKSNSGIILITHDLGVVAQMADRVAVMYAGQIVEEASAFELYEHPLHPYTRSLLRSIPQNLDDDEERNELHVIQGTVPSLRNMPRHGCRFAPRIPWIPQDAHEDNPTLHEVKPGHLVRCTCWEHFEFKDGD
ncbi:MAG: ABC transporter ATP-binding protein [Aerococcus sp.]|nr:ABC transporter ATP-binding protein [Aerococcus sp.]